jgi:hypothetical protein
MQLLCIAEDGGGCDLNFDLRCMPGCKYAVHCFSAMNVGGAPPCWTCGSQAILPLHVLRSDTGCDACQVYTGWDRRELLVQCAHTTAKGDILTTTCSELRKA